MENNFIENNILLAKFMGWHIEYLPFDPKYPDQQWVMTKCDDQWDSKQNISFNPEKAETVLAEMWETLAKYRANYKKDWNKLMPVVEKIESLGFFFHILGSGCFIDTGDKRWVKYLNPNKTCLLSSTDFIDYQKDEKPEKMEAVYTLCVEFVKWYNNIEKY